ncbi:MAG: FAD-binding protein [Candidatus Marsarchaeota archaeon]|jgi:succinate dehydrogenase / fumarate reductase flavoprotein subunit|nr:FAD-binding protein [Candidatus Marsarchaeota archaeon]
MEYDTYSCDVLILGSGGAGLRAALAALDSNCSVIIISKSLLGKAHTVMAEGGIAASVANVDTKDNWKVHFADTIIEGDYIGNWQMAEILAKEAPDAVYELERMGALFDRTQDGKIMQRAFGGHTYKRLCHVGDKTGLEIIRTLEDGILHRKAVIFDETLATTLTKDDESGRITGAVGLHMRSGRFAAFIAKSVVIATGGLGRIYKVTSNSWESTGDGIALAFKSGAELSDMEMVQFHPTGMVWPNAARGLLVTESVRGEGGLLYNSKGERFMLKYSPEKKELDARDVVARSIYYEIQKGNCTEHGGVYLDIMHKGPDFIKKKLPGMYTQFMEFANVDITKERMEVAPTVHYFMGGIRTDPESCMTNISGLFAAGEAASGLHGANRLGGNSLADILIFGRRAGTHAAEYAKQAEMPEIKSSTIISEIKRVKEFLADGRNEAGPYSLLDRLRDAMQQHLGIIREEKSMKEGLEKVRSIRSELKKVKTSGTTSFNHGLMECIALENMALLAECMFLSAIERKESRGAHTRSDYPKKSIKWKLNILCSNKSGSIKLSHSSLSRMPKELSEIIGEEHYN